MTTKIKSGVIAAGAVDATALSDNSITIAHLNCSDGTNGQFLKTDGSGTLSFADGGVDGIVSSADATAITIDSSENVGIGKTPNRSRKLEVAGTMNLDDGSEYEWGDGSISIGGNSSTDIMTFATAGVERMRIDSSGKVIIEKSSDQLRLTDGSLGYDIGYDNSYLRFKNSAGDTQAVINWSTGNVGIGATSPGHPLSVRQNSGTDPQIHLETSAYGNAYGVKILAASTNEAATTSSFYNLHKTTASVNGRSDVQQHLSFVGSSAASDYQYWSTGGTERMRIGSSGGITISNSPANTGEALGQPDMSKTTEGGIHFTSGGTQTSKGITWEAGGNGQTQAGIVCHNNDSNGTHLGFFTTYSYNAGPLCQMKLDQYGSLVLGASIDVTTVNSPSQHNAIFVSAGDIVVDSSHGNVELSDLLPGYTRGDYNCVKSSGSNLYFAVNGSYVSYINHNGTYTISDSRLKENVTTLTGSLEKIKQLRGVNFTWADTESRGSDTQLGFLAQEVEPHFPEAVGDGGLPNPNDENDEPYKNVSYATLVPALVEAIKELSSELDAAKARITILEG